MGTTDPGLYKLLIENLLRSGWKRLTGRNSSPGQDLGLPEVLPTSPSHMGVLPPTLRGYKDERKGSQDLFPTLAFLLQSMGCLLCLEAGCLCQDPASLPLAL